MTYPIRITQVRRALQPVLGTRFVTETALCDRAAEILRAYNPRRVTAEGLCRQLKELIFSELYELLGHQMLLRLENGAVRRILLRDVDFMVDEVVGVLLEVLQPPEITLEGLRGFAMQRGSLAAMRVMLERFGDEMDEMEKEMLRRIIRENHPTAGYGNL